MPRNNNDAASPPQAILLPASIVLLLTRHYGGAWIVGTLGTVGWSLVALAYAVFDAKKLWPEASVWERLRRVLMFAPD